MCHISGKQAEKSVWHFHMILSKNQNNNKPKQIKKTPQNIP